MDELNQSRTYEPSQNNVKEIIREVPVYYEKIIDRPVIVEKKVEVAIEKPIFIDKIVEITKPVTLTVEKIVEKEVEKRVYIDGNNEFLNSEVNRLR